jgi:hypothetical protein
MGKGHIGLPKVKNIVIKKSSLISDLELVDSDRAATQRVLRMESEFRSRMSHHVSMLPIGTSKFQKFNTSPFVLMLHCLHQRYSRVSQIERDILPAKQFASMETSAGRMIEDVTLPIYEWETVPSKMHSINSALDGKCLEGNTLKLVTIKSGPRCLNDEMSENFADSILANTRQWASEAGVNHIDFTYGVLYGTEKQSNKKDWHILRNLKDKLPSEMISISPDNRWNCEFRKDKVTVSVSIAIGINWWRKLGGRQCFMELCIAMVRACVGIGEADRQDYNYTIADLGAITSTSMISNQFNVSILQRSQIPWLFLLARHFCDELQDA